MTEPKEENSKKWGEKYRRIVDWKNEENNTIRHKCPLHKSRESAPIKYKLTTSTNYNQLSIKFPLKTNKISFIFKGTKFIQNILWRQN